jgi:glutaconate CoA-transferase subunit B
MIPAAGYTPEEMMVIAAARRFRDGATCFVGVGLPGTAGCLALALHAPGATLVYESGAIGSRPKVIPLSIADPELANTAVAIASTNEVFTYWLQGGRIDLGVLGAAQIDRFGNINSTVIGDYVLPRVRLPGAGGAPHIAAYAKEIVIIVRQDLKTFVPRLDFVTTPHCNGPTTVITDLGILETDPETGELVLTGRCEGVTLDQIREATGWPLRFADRVEDVPVPEARELRVLRDLNERTRMAHGPGA